MLMREIDFWFSIGSTYTYLSVNRLAEVSAKQNIKFNWHPFSVRKIMMDMDNIPFIRHQKKLNQIICGEILKEEQILWILLKYQPYPLKEFDLANQLQF